jgi:hypothetical protein
MREMREVREVRGVHDLSELKRALLPMMLRARYHEGYSAVAGDRAPARRERR